jgi:hypothetical protein
MSLSRSDVVEIMRCAGVEITGGQADRWSRRDDDTERGKTGMTEDQFDAFTRGLVEWTKKST